MITNHEILKHDDDMPSCVKITVGETIIFLGVKTGLNIETVRQLVDEIIQDDKVHLSSDMRLWTSQGCVIQVGTTINRKVVPLIGKVNLNTDKKLTGPSSRLMKDGTIGKSEWRFKIDTFVGDIFPNGGLKDKQVIFLPGTGLEEIKLWRRWGAIEDNMLMIEGDEQEYNVLLDRYKGKIQSPQIINTFIGGNNSDIHSYLGKNEIGAISLDTEVSLTQGLYDEIIALFQNAHVGDDTFFMLNIVRRGAKSFCNKYETGNNDPIEFCMNMLIDSIIDTLGNDLFYSQNSTFGTYLGGSSTPMSYIMCHIKQR